MIPKNEGASFLKDFCPISLRNVTYKIVSNNFVNRLRKFLPLLISDNPAGFVPGRRASDHLIIAKELFMNKSYWKIKWIAYIQGWYLKRLMIRYHGLSSKLQWLIWVLIFLLWIKWRIAFLLSIPFIESWLIILLLISLFLLAV